MFILRNGYNIGKRARVNQTFVQLLRTSFVDLFLQTSMGADMCGRTCKCTCNLSQLDNRWL